MAEGPRQTDDRPSWLSRFARIVGIGVAAAAILQGVLGKAPVPRSPQPAAGDGQPPSQPEHGHVHYEPTDARFGWIFAILIGSAILLFVAIFAVLGFFFRSRALEADIKRSNYPLAAQTTRALPPSPRLEQVNRMAGIDKGNVYLLDVQKEQVLNGYGPSDEEGYVHIPIDQAMDYLADKLPVRSERPSAGQERRQNGLVDAGASNSGRMFRRK